MRDLFFSLLLLLSISHLYAQEWPARMDSVLNILSDEELFHGQVLVAENGIVEFEKAYGKMDGRSIQKDTPLAIASVSKAFTALSILILEEQGKLSLTNELTDYFPKLPYKVTLERMLNMTSGLPRFQPIIDEHADQSGMVTTSDIIELVAKHQPEAGEPGDSFSYNGDNYVLLAAIVQKVSGQPYAAFVKQHIFEPLAMNDSYVFNPDQSMGQEPLSVNNGPALGAGYIYSTVTDLYRFSEGLRTNQLVSAEILSRSFEFTRLNDGSLSNYGFAWRLHKEGELFETYIVGDGEDTRASLQRYLNSNKTFIYLHNVSGSNWNGVYGAIRNIWEGKPFEMPQKREVFPIDKALYKKYEGQYLSKAFGLLHITSEDGKLYLRPDPIPGKEELVPSSETTFYFAEQALEWEFYLDGEGNVKGLGLRGKPETMGPRKKK